MPDRMPEDMPDRMPEAMPDRIPDRMPEDLPVLKRINLNVMVGITRSKVWFFYGDATSYIDDETNNQKLISMLVKQRRIHHCRQQNRHLSINGWHVYHPQS